MDINFNLIINRLLEYEGTYVNNPFDPGGETKFGISKKAYPKLDIKHLTRNQAIKIYYGDYWVKNKLDKLNNFKISALLFNLVVNIGSNATLGIVKEIIGKGNYIECINSLNISRQNEVLQFIKQKAELYYKSIVLKNPNLKIFLNGWLKRLNDLANK